MTTASAFNAIARMALLLLGSALAAANAHAEWPDAPKVNAAILPTIDAGWAELNPYRGNAEAIGIGRDAFHQSCAKCHGANADGSRMPAPDLRRVGLTCGRVHDAALKQRCQSDADFYFVKSVRFGKQKFGIVHMPPWDGVLEPRVVWAIRSYIESVPRR